MSTVPALHFEQNDAPNPASVPVPSGHAVQRDCPGSALKFPGEHGIHVDDELAPVVELLVPGIQGEHFAKASAPGMLL